jgi:hypothetical protein
VVRAVVPPTVPTRRVRVCLHAGNTFAEVEGLVKKVDEWLVTKVDSVQHQQEFKDTKARL